MTTIIHLSDIHLKGKSDKIFSKLKKFNSAVKPFIIDVKQILVIVSGDLAYSGQAKQYEAFELLMNSVNEFIASNSQATQVDWIFCPGNHDCDFGSDQGTLRTILLNKLTFEDLDSLDESGIEILKKPLFNYEEFVNDNESNLLVRDDLIAKRYFVDVNGFKIEINSYNTALTSMLKEKYGSLLYPINNIKSNWQELQSDIRISVYHHHFSWLHPHNRRPFVNHIEANSEIVLSGHEHERESSIRTTATTQGVLYFETEAFQDSNSIHKSSFRVLTLNPEKQSITSNDFYYFEGDYKENSVVEYSLKPMLNNPLRQSLSDSAIAWLQSTETVYAHPGTDAIYLDQIFVYPQLKNISPSEDITNPKYKSSELCLIDSTTGIPAVITGAESSGKSTLCKWAFKVATERGLKPVYIKSEDISGISKSDIYTVAKDSYNLFYNVEGESNFSDIDNKDIFFILDDLQRATTNDTQTSVFLKNLASIYPNHILFGSSFCHLSKESGGIVPPLDDYTIYEIMEMGPPLRNQLISKWNALFSSLTFDQKEAIKRHDDTYNFVSNIIVNNYIPAYPVFILTMLQTFTSGNSSSEMNMHGYYYQYLIQSALKRATKKRDNIGLYNNFLTFYCKFLFEHKIRFNGVPERELFTILDRFRETFAIASVENKEIIDNLLRARLLKYKEGNFNLAYKYVYYYFVAKALVRDFDNPETQDLVSNMCLRVHREEFSNIILFIVHLQSGTQVINELVRAAELAFAEFEECTLEVDSNHVNDLIQELPEATLQFLNSQDAREFELYNEAEREQVEREYKKTELEQKVDLHEDVNNLDTISRIIRCVKLIEILGQVARKQWAELDKKNKIKLCNTVYSLALRCMSFVHHTYRFTLEELIRFIQIHMDNGHVKPVSKESLKEQSSKMIFKYISFADFGIIKRVSNAIGTRDLEPIFSHVLENNNTTAVQLIDLGIEIDHYKEVPTSKVYALYSKHDKKFIVQSIIQKLVLSHMHMYDLNYKTKQQLCSKLGISIKDQRRVSANSKMRGT